MLKKNYSLLVKRGKIPLKRGPESNIAYGAPIFCSRHQRVNINENQICYKCSVIKWETFIRKSFEKNYSLLVKRGKIPLKRGLKSNIALGAPTFCSRHQRVRKNIIFIHPQEKGPRETTFKKKKTHNNYYFSV